jgi:peptide/nickel transport system permease protein
VLKLVSRRLLTMIPILLGVVFLATLLVDLLPGDPALTLAGEDAPPNVIAQIRDELRLDEPVWERFADNVGGLIQGDMGTSPVSRLDVGQQIMDALPITLSVVFVAMSFSLLIALVGGTVAALRHGRLADRVIVLFASVLQAAPPFVVGLVLVIVFAVKNQWFPAVGYVKFGDDPWEWLRHLILPGFTLALPIAAVLIRQVRSALIDVLEQDYIRACRAKGLTEARVLVKHAAKNAATPVVTVLGNYLGAILGGAVIVEIIFAMPGYGALALSAVLGRDMPMIQGVVVIGGAAVLLVNLLVDISYGYFNPKVRT